MGLRELSIVVCLGAASAIVVFGRQDPSDADAEPPAPHERIHRPATPPPTTPQFARPGASRPGPTTLALLGPTEPTRGPSVEVEAALALLPQDTLIVGWTPDYLMLTQQFGLARVLSQYRTQLTEPDERLAKFGLDLMDLSDPTPLGIDASGPALFAVLSATAPTLVLAARISDPDALDRTLDTLINASGMPFRTEVLDDGELRIHDVPNPRVAFLRRSGQIFAVLGDRYDSKVRMAVDQIAYQDIESGLPSVDVFQRVTEPVKGDLGVLFVNGPVLYAQTSEGRRLNLAEAQPYTDRRFEKEDDPALNARMREYQRREAERQAGEDATLNALLGSLGAAALGLALEDGRIGLDGVIEVAPGSLLRRLLVNRTSSSHLQRAIDQAPVFLLDTKMGVDALAELARVFSAMVGGDLDLAMAAVKGFGGIDGDPFEILSGELGVVVFADDLAGDTDWGFTVVVGVAKPEEAQQLIDRLGGLATLAGQVEYEEETGGIRMDLPGMHPAHLARVGDCVAVTTDLGFFDRLQTRGGGLLGAFDRADLGTLTSRVGGVGEWVWDVDMLAGMFRVWSIAPGVLPTDTPDDRENRRTADLNALQREIYDIEHRQQVRERERGLAILSVLGSVAGAAQWDGDRLRLRGGLYYEAYSAADLVATLFELATGGDDEAELTPQRRLTDLYQRRDKLLSVMMAERPPVSLVRKPE